jgi:K+-transporting ATPase A subunit
MNMNWQIRCVSLALLASIFAIGLWSCGPVNYTHDSNGPSGIFATLYQSGSGVITEVPCHSAAITWTASSTTGSTQTYTSPEIPLTDNSTLLRCDKYQQIEGQEVTSCGCPRKAVFTSLAPGTWNLSVLNVSCSVDVKGGTNYTVEMYTDGRACKVF